MTRGGKVLQVPKVSLLCDTGAQVDCVSRAQLRGLGLIESQLLQPAVTVGCANGTAAHVVGVFFGKVTAMDGADKVQARVMFYVVKTGGNILSRNTCETLGVVDEDFPKVGKHLGAKTRVSEVSCESAVYQEVGQCDPDSEYPCRCPRRIYEKEDIGEKSRQKYCTSVLFFPFNPLPQPILVFIFFRVNMPPAFRQCSYCSNNSQNSPAVLFFTVSEHILRGLNYAPKKASFICEHHFSPEDIKDHGTSKRLRENAFPMNFPCQETVCMDHSYVLTTPLVQVSISPLSHQC